MYRAAIPHQLGQDLQNNQTYRTCIQARSIANEATAQKTFLTIPEIDATLPQWSLTTGRASPKIYVHIGSTQAQRCVGVLPPGYKLEARPSWHNQYPDYLPSGRVPFPISFYYKLKLRRAILT